MYTNAEITTHQSRSKGLEIKRLNLWLIVINRTQHKDNNLLAGGGNNFFISFLDRAHLLVLLLVLLLLCGRPL